MYLPKKNTTNKQTTIKCDHCEKSFSSKQDLNRHVSAVHDGRKPFQCPICFMEVSFQGNLRKHIREIHDKINNSNVKNVL